MKQFIAIAVVLGLCSCAPNSRDTLFGSTSAALRDSQGLTGTIYFIPENSPELPDFATLEPEGTVYTNTLDIPATDFETGFPGISDRFEWFAIAYEGMFSVATAGQYQFDLLSDDGSKLYVDDVLIIDNDGIHGVVQVSGTVDLVPGQHSLKVAYFQGPRTEIALQLFVTPPAGDTEIFDSSKQY